MGSDNTVGSVTLELLIDDSDISEQLEQSAQKAKKPAETAFQKVGQSAKDGLDKALSSTKKIVQKQVIDPWEKSHKAFEEKLQKHTPRFEIATDGIDLLQQKLENTYAQICATEKQLRKAEKGYGVAEASEQPEQKKAYKNEMTALQAKLISLQSTANATEKKISDAVNAPAKAAEKAAEQARKAYEKAARDAQKAFERSYKQIAQQAQNAATQAKKWALNAERAQSKSASRAAKHAEKAYNKQL